MHQGSGQEVELPTREEAGEVGLLEARSERESPVPGRGRVEYQ
jgi:hypothetical protein